MNGAKAHPTRDRERRQAGSSHAAVEPSGSLEPRTMM
jgi:hypothetical protein